MRLKIGTSVRQPGTLLTLSKKGNLRPYKKVSELPIGVNNSILIRGRIAREVRPGVWQMEGIVDPELTAISMSYFAKHKDETL